MSSELQFLVSLSIDAYGPVGVFDTKQGGDIDSTPVRHRPGGMGPEVVYPALPVYGPITLGRVVDNEFRTDSALIGVLEQYVGRSMATVTEQPLDAEGNAWGTPTTYRGMFSAIHVGNVDSQSENPRMWDVMVESVTKVN